MGDVIADAALWLTGMRRNHVSRYVAYSSGGVTAPCIATASQTVFETQSEMGVIERWESRDFVIAVADLPVEEPQRGDRITETLNGESVTFDVCAPRGAPIWKWADASRTAVRIHSKAIS